MNQRIREAIKASVPVAIFAALLVVMWQVPPAVPIKATPAFTKPVEPKADFVRLTDSPKQPAAALKLKGTLQAFSAKSINAPVSGTIEKILKTPGMRVKAGDVVAMISDQNSQALQAEKELQQQKAQKAQLEAARRQSILQAKLQRERQLLDREQRQLNNANNQLKIAKQLQRRLNNGEKVPVSALQHPSKTAMPEIAADNEKALLLNAQQQAKNAAQKAQQLWQQLHLLKTQQLQNNSQKKSLTSNKSTFEKQIAFTQSAAQQAQKKADSLRIKAFRLQQKMNSAKVTKPDIEYLTQARLDNFTQKARNQKEQAQANVETIEKQIARYQAPENNIADASSHLQQVRQDFARNNVNTKLTPVIAQAAGEVQKVLSVGTQVEANQELATVVPRYILKLEITTKNKFWQNLANDAKMNVSVQNTAQKVLSRESKARLLKITPPAQKGGAATLHFQVFNPVKKKTNSENVGGINMPQVQRWFAPGMTAILKGKNS